MIVDVSGRRPIFILQDAAAGAMGVLFHLEVPGGRWHTVTARPVSAANRASSVFHARTRYPLDPPASAQTRSWVGVGSSTRPACGHQRRSVDTANAAVSWSVPTDTQPALAPRSSTP
jgi:hypothetical protein